MGYSELIFTDNYCVACGNPLGFRRSTEFFPKVLLDSHLAQISAVSKNGRVVHGCVYNAEDGEFEKDGYRHRSVFDEFGVLEINHNDDDQSLLLHTNCYNFVKKTLNIALHIKNVPIQNKRVAIDYGAMSIYQGLTFFELDRMISDDNLWILKSPLKIGDHHSKNAERMQSIAAQFVASNAEFI